MAISLFSAIGSGAETSRSLREMKEADPGTPERIEKTVEVVSRALVTALLAYGAVYQIVKE